MLPHTALATFATLNAAQAPLHHLQDETIGAISTVPILNIDENPTGLLDATAWSIIYSYPLAVFANWAGGALRNASVNQIIHQRTLSSPNDLNGILKPNVDTVYSRAVLDLSSQDVLLTIPEFEDDRYYLYPVYDAFGNAIAEIGAVNGNGAGDYLIRRSDDVHAEPGFEESPLSTLRGIVNLPTNYGTMLIRILILQNTTEDLDAVHHFQDGSRLTAVNRSADVNARNPAPALADLPLNGSLLGIGSPEQQLEFAARLIPYNLPYLFSERYRVASILSQASLYTGHYLQPENINLTEASAIANVSITADIEKPRGIANQGNNWRLQTPAYQGTYGIFYAPAANVALGGYQQLTQQQTLYPEFGGQQFQTIFHLKPNSSFLFTLSGKPKLKKYGFWSLTAYGANQYLIPNPINRGSVGDRTWSLTYPDGEAVYGPEADSERDGPFQILIQDSEVPPPGNWTGNWLPVERTFSWIFRYYVPDAALTDGSYVYPKVENISAIV